MAKKNSTPSHNELIPCQVITRRDIPRALRFQHQGTSHLGHCRPLFLFQRLISHQEIKVRSSMDLMSKHIVSKTLTFVWLDCVDFLFHEDMSRETGHCVANRNEPHNTYPALQITQHSHLHHVMRLYLKKREKC